ncbi:MAG TPA: DUF5701 family protein [Nocardioidaceae bacterium]|nr:DUF5701 family protein [Nocardioidaceae bacterium]
MSQHELDRQIQDLHGLGYPALAGLAPADFDALVEPLREQVAVIEATGPDPTDSAADDRIPFLLVVRSSLVATVDAVARWSVRGKAGWTDMEAELSGYQPLEDLAVPDDRVYLLLDVDTGRDTLGVSPDDALPKIRAAGRTPLTVDEGVALVTHFPDVFTSHNAFQALGSRAQNKRVPSFWVSKGAPRLGWCWAGNPHSWLGAASAGGRVGVR